MVTYILVSHKMLMSRSIILILLILTGCSGEHQINMLDRANRQQILHINIGAEVQDIDPHIVTGVPESRVISALFEGLTTKDGQTLVAQPGMAESWQVSADGKTYIFNLRDDAYWSNGDLLQAEDFIFAWQRLLSPQLGAEYASMLYSVVNAKAYNLGKIKDFEQVGVKAIDRHTLQVKLTRKTPYFLQLLDHYATYPLHRSTLEKFDAVHRRGSRWTRPSNIVTNGPFTLQEWQTNRYIRVARHANYWNAERIKLNGIYFYPVENVAVAERMFRARQLHINSGLPISKIPIYEHKYANKIRINPYMGIYYYEFNVLRPPLNDVRIRQALALSIDRSHLLGTILKGGEMPSIHFIPPNIANYQNADSPLKYDPIKARRLLAKAGYPNGQGFPKLNILYNNSAGNQLLAAVVQEMWRKELNIEVGLLNQEWEGLSHQSKQR